MSNKIISIEKNGFQWKTDDPYIICMHHQDAYPKGNEAMGPVGSLSGRRLGSDFSGIEGFSMYHGRTVPGFPVHPHRGFETVTIVLEGYVDHFDSLGSSGRYGQGDVQWLTTGRGCQHAEMFPLLNEDTDNPLELFQIWLNLPAKSKFAEPDYKMLWHEKIPKIERTDANGRKIHATLIAGSYGPNHAVQPAKNSWAADPSNKIRIMLLTIEPNAIWTLKEVDGNINRNLYFYRGQDAITVEGETVYASSRIKLSGSDDIEVVNGNHEAFLLLMEGEPINEPVVAHGPFVMNNMSEIQEAINDYNATGFGGWPWESEAPVFPRDMGRIANYADGYVEEPIKK